MSNTDQLKGLYPFLHGERQDPVKREAALLASIEAKAREARDVNAQFFAAQASVLLAAAHAVADVYRREGRMFAMGNGGSSSDASHFAVEFVHPITAGRPALPAINLVADIAMISAVGNDLGFEHIFVRQLLAQARAADGLIGFSTSGNSANLVAAFVKAKEMGLVTIGLTGGDGGKMKTSGVVDHCLIVPSTSIHRIQESHETAYHILWDLVHTLLADDRGSAAGGGSS
jgi:D-sedoheptulose 7-phosphate isomerase